MIIEQKVWILTFTSQLHNQRLAMAFNRLPTIKELVHLIMDEAFVREGGPTEDMVFEVLAALKAHGIPEIREGRNDEYVNWEARNLKGGTHVQCLPLINFPIELVRGEELAPNDPRRVVLPRGRELAPNE